MSDTPPSAEKIAANYAAMLDSVALINGSKPDVIGMSDSEWAANVEANKEHQYQGWLTGDVAIMYLGSLTILEYPMPL